MKRNCLLALLAAFVMGCATDTDTLSKNQQNKVIGEWKDEGWPGNALIKIYEDSGTIKMKKSFADGSNQDTTLIESMYSGKPRFEEVGNDFGEYYLINENGELEIYDKEGFIRKARVRHK